MSDSRIDTGKHINEVRRLLASVVGNLAKRYCDHDLSKLSSPEVEVFDEFTPLLAGVTYGSEEYCDMLRMIQPALDHHYGVNRHHPGHWPNGVRDMDLMDLVEMLCDWMAATKRHADGDVPKSIEINQKRFGYSDELKGIFLNTVAGLQPEEIMAEDALPNATRELKEAARSIREEFGL